VCEVVVAFVLEVLDELEEVVVVLEEEVLDEVEVLEDVGVVLESVEVLEDVVVLLTDVVRPALGKEIPTAPPTATTMTIKITRADLPMPGRSFVKSKGFCA
jgi:hypothetical protein